MRIKVVLIVLLFCLFSFCFVVFCVSVLHQCCPVLDEIKAADGETRCFVVFPVKIKEVSRMFKNARV